MYTGKVILFETKRLIINEAVILNKWLFNKSLYKFLVTEWKL